MTNRCFISIDGICKDCKYPVICDSGDVAEDKDYHLYCSNPDCKNHKGVLVYDTELDEDNVPFMYFKRWEYR